MTPLEDFRDRLADLRRRCDRGRARGVAVCLLAGTSATEFAALVDEETDRLVAAGVGYPRLDERWDAAIVAAGVDYLRRGWHLGPARVRPECSSQYHYVLDQDVRPEVVHREGGSRLGAHAAASVGLFGEALAGVVLGWMRAHGVPDPLGPWRLAAADGVTVAGPEHARWIVRPGPGGKRWRGVPLAEAMRLLDRNADYSAELDQLRDGSGRQDYRDGRGELREVYANGRRAALDPPVLVGAGRAVGVGLEPVDFRHVVVALRSVGVRTNDGDWPSDGAPVIGEGA